MGISLQVYRSRIGTFLSTRKKLTSMKSESTKSRSWYPETIFIFLVVFIGLASYVNVYHHKHLSQLQLHVPRYCQQVGTMAGACLVSDNTNHNLDRPCRITSKQRNFLAKIVNGNRGSRGPGLKCLHWNKGPSFLHNKHDEIETIIASHHPHILGLSEANIRNDHDKTMVQHSDYNLHLSPTSNNS